MTTFDVGAYLERANREYAEDMAKPVVLPENAVPLVTASGVTVYGRVAEGYLLAEAHGMRYFLTDCCGASAKGLEDCIGCRGCYHEVDPSLGDVYTAKRYGPVVHPLGPADLVLLGAL